jgi:SAM-dependent methyltransferase
MLDLLAGEAGRPVTLLDFGCGASHLYEYLLKQQRTDVAYSGLDISPRFLELSRRKFPHITYYDLDVLERSHDLPTFDYVVMNGLFNAKCDLSFDVMLRRSFRQGAAGHRL